MEKKQHKYPHLFKFVRSKLHIPATSVPSERVFSLAGYVVRERRSRILAKNVNKAIFLKANANHIPRNTTVWSETRIDSPPARSDSPLDLSERPPARSESPPTP